jgi:hypothetical protein
MSAQEVKRRVFAKKRSLSNSQSVANAAITLMSNHHLNSNSRQATTSEKKTGASPRLRYQTPRIATHSSRKLRETLLRVQAATNLNPNP